MIVEIRNHPRNPAVVLARTPPDLAKTMGLFGPARWSETHRAYLVEADQLGSLETFLRVHGSHRLVDERDTGTSGGPEKYSGPLPECANCRQPASRKAALTIAFCPGCLQPWRIGAPDLADPVKNAPRVECPGCGSRERAGFTGCTRCGARLPAPAGTNAPFPPLPREPLLAPMPLGQVLDEQLPIDHQEAM